MKGTETFEEKISTSRDTRLLCPPGRFSIVVRWKHVPTPFKINLVVGDFFESHSTLLSTSTYADELITWLQSKSQVLALLCGKCRELRLNVASVLRAVITRWTAHYLAYH